MFHRIKSEPQSPVKKEETTAEQAQETTNTAQTETAQTKPANTQSDMSPIEKFAAQQASSKSNKNEEATATATAPTGNKTKQQTEEAKTMTSLATENTEEQKQEEKAAYRAPSSTTGGYPGSYGGTGYTAPAAPAPAATTATTTATTSSETPVAQNENDGGRLVIGSGITMSGEIEACPHLVVEGTVEASLRGAEILEVSQGGVFFGTVEIVEATISGRFEGDITVTGRLTVTQTGQVTGSITYGELQMESGATIDGKLTPMTGRAATAARPAAKASVAPKTNTTAEASNDAQLFSEGAVAAAE